MKTWIAKLQENYSSFEEWESYAETYGLDTRLGFETSQDAWDANPLIGGSTNPGDFGIVTLDEFTHGYIECALWLLDENPPSGQYPETLLQRYFSNLAPETLLKMVADCAKFQEENADFLAKVSYPKNDSTDMAHAGHDFWLTRCGHGAGFWDGDLPEALGEALTAAAKIFGNVDLYVGDDGKIYA